MACTPVGEKVNPLILIHTYTLQTALTGGNDSPADIYHVTIMPCYDKKLEASRQDFYNDVFSTRDVDCVVTTGELELLLDERGYDLEEEEDNDREESMKGTTLIPELLHHPGSSSGSYLQWILDDIVRSAGPLTVKIERRTIRSDYEDIVVRKNTGDILFKGARCYGFRNLQNMVRKIGKESGVNIGSGAAGRAIRNKTIARKRTKTNDGDEQKSYDYVEIMACPGGCVNGGGQLSRPTEFTGSSGGVESGMGRWGDKEWMGKVEERYWEESAAEEPDERYHEAERLSHEIRGTLETKSSEGGDPFRTRYRKVESEVIGLAVQW